MGLSGGLATNGSFGGGSGSGTLAGDTDVVLATPVDGQVLTYNAATSKWKNIAPSAVGTPLQPVATVTTSITATVGKQTPVDATTGAITITLPTGAALGSQIGVEKEDTSANIVSITGSIRGVGAQTQQLTAQFRSVSFLADSTGSWWPFTDIKPLAYLQTILASIASPAFTGVPTAPTAAGGTNTTQLATTAFVNAAIAAASYVSMKVNGTVQTQRGALNLIAGSNVTLSAVDNAGSNSTDVTVASSGGGGGLAINLGSSLTGAVTLANPATYTMQYGTMTGNCAITMPTAVAGESFLLTLYQDATTGGHTWTLSGSVAYPAGTPNDVLTPSGVNVMECQCWDGVTWNVFPATSAATMITTLGVTFLGAITGETTQTRYVGASTAAGFPTTGTYQQGDWGINGVGTASPTLWICRTAGTAGSGAVFSTLGGGASTLAADSDVSITSPAQGQVLQYNGSVWANAAPPGLPKLVAPFHPQLFNALSATGANFRLVATRITIPFTGTLRNLACLVGAASGSMLMAVYDTGDALAGNYSLLWTSASTLMSGLTANAWNIVGDPPNNGTLSNGFTGAVTAGQQLHLALMVDNQTATFGRFAAVNAGVPALPAGFIPAAGGASPKLNWYNTTPVSLVAPATVTEANALTASGSIFSTIATLQ